MSESRMKLKWCLAIAFVSVSIVSLIAIIAVNQYSQRVTSSIVKELSDVAIVTMREDAIDALAGLGLGSLQENMNSIAETQAVRYIELYDLNDERIALSGYQSPSHSSMATVSHSLKTNGSLITSGIADARVVGRLVIGLDQTVLFESYHLSRTLYIVLIVAMCSLFIVLINVIFAYKVFSPIRKIDEYLDLLSLHSWNEPKLSDLYGDEIGQIAKKVDDTSRAIYENSIRSKQIENQMIASEERADAVLISSLTSIAETADALDKVICDIDRSLVGFLTFADRNDELSLYAKDIFNAMRKVRSHVSILQAGGDINRNIMHLSPKNILFTDLISVLVNILDVDDYVENIPSRDGKNCYIDYLRLSALLQKMASIIHDFTVDIEISESGESNILLNIKMTESQGQGLGLTESDVNALSKAFIDGESGGDIGATKENDIIYALVVSELLGADIHIRWSRVNNRATADLTIPILLRDSGSPEFIPRSDRNMTIVTNEEPVLPSKFLIEQYGVAIDVVNFNDADISSLVSKDCVILDCSQGTLDQSVYLATSISEYCDTKVVQKPKIGALFYKAELTDQLVDQLMTGGFDFPYHKPYKVNKILSEFDQLITMSDVSKFVGN